MVRDFPRAVLASKAGAFAAAWRGCAGELAPRRSSIPPRPQTTSSAFHLCAASLIALAIRGEASADRGALSLEAGAGGTSLALRAPGAASTQGISFVASLGLRYALENWVEIEANGYFEPPTTYFQNGVRVGMPGGPFGATLRHRLHRYGALAGGRLVTGKVWRFVVGGSVGFCHRAYSDFQFIDDSQPNAPRDLGLKAPNFSLDNWVLAAVAGVEWAQGDHWSLSLLPRYEQLLGDRPTFALSARLLFSVSWYL
jgi:hypothetical protein